MISNEKVRCYDKDGRNKLIYKDLTTDPKWMEKHGFTLAEPEMPPFDFTKISENAKKNVNKK